MLVEKPRKKKKKKSMAITISVDNIVRNPNGSIEILFRKNGRTFGHAFAAATSMTDRSAFLDDDDNLAMLFLQMWRSRRSLLGADDDRILNTQLVIDWTSLTPITLTPKVVINPL